MLVVLEDLVRHVDPAFLAGCKELGVGWREVLRWAASAGGDSGDQGDQVVVAFGNHDIWKLMSNAS